MTLEEIKELIQTVKASGIAELEVQRGENRVWIKRTGVSTQEIVLPAAPSTSVSAPAAATAPAEEAPPSYVRSPLVGTFYEAPSPGASPFVKVGDTVQTGQVLCIVEAMKLMNEVQAESAGVIVSKLVENAQPVEYGQTLFGFRPL